MAKPNTAPPRPSPAVLARDGAAPQGHRNEVLLAGRITAEPSARELASGDHLVSWRLAIARPPGRRAGHTAGTGHPVDAVTCTSFRPEVHEAVRGWRIGDVVRVSGALRRRFWRTRQGAASVFEVEVHEVGRVRSLAE